MRLGTLCLVGALLGPIFPRPGAACINDRETSKQEREFRSNYGDPEPYQPQPVPQPPPLMAGWSAPALMGLGAILLTGAGFLAVQTRSKD